MQRAPAGWARAAGAHAPAARRPARAGRSVSGEPEPLSARAESLSGEPEPVSGEDFRAVLGSVPQPVSVVTSCDEDRPHGTTVSALCSLSLDPPLVLVSLDRQSELLELIRRSGRYAINILARGQEQLAYRFARKGRDKFEGVEWRIDGGLPRLDGTQGWLVCEVHQLVEAGDHVIAIGLVCDAETEHGVHPLVYREQAFWRLA